MDEPTLGGEGNADGAQGSGSGLTSTGSGSASQDDATGSGEGMSQASDMGLDPTRQTTTPERPISANPLDTDI